MFNIPIQIVNSSLQSNTEVPFRLELLKDNTLWFVGVLLILSIVLIAFTRFFEATYIKEVVKNYFKFSSVESLQKSHFKLGSVGSVLLLINYLLCLWVCFILFLNAFLPSSIYELILISALSTGAVVLYQFIGLGLTAWVTGETEFIKEHVVQTIIGFQFAGILLLILGVFWTLYPGFRVELFYSFAFLLLSLIFIRLVRGIISSLIARIPWYYIILYFCTLEILPILVTYFYVARNFKV